MGKGEATRQTILERAMRLASVVGLEGLSIGRLAHDLDLSKSGLFAHFQSKQALQLQVLQHAASRFVDTVVKPALAAPSGEPRLEAAFNHWMEWPTKNSLPGGCVFVAAVAEQDDRPGPVRDLLARIQRDWLDVLAGLVRTCVSEARFRPDVDAEQLAHDLYGVMLAYHHAARLLADPLAASRARRGMDALIRAARKPGMTGNS